MKTLATAAALAALAGCGTATSYADGSYTWTSSSP